MFKHLRDFDYKRSAKEAFGFYIVYLIGTACVAAVIGATASLFVQEDGMAAGIRLGTIVGIIASITLSFVILSAKKLTSNPYYLFLALVGGLMQLIGGGIISLIVPAYFSTLKKKAKK